MSAQAWCVQGWAILTAGEADVLANKSVLPIAPVFAKEWIRPATGGCGTVVVATAASVATVRIVPGSQGLDFCPFYRAAAIELALQPGVAIAIDAQLLLQADDGVSLSLLAVPDETPSIRSEELALWHSRGFTFLRGALSAGRIAALRAAIDEAQEADVAAWGEPQLRALGQFGALRNLSDLGPEFVQLLDDNPAYRIVDQILQPGYILQAFDGLVLHPGDGRYPWDFHTDLQALVGASFPRDRTLAVNVLYFLDATTVENGATWLVPHSHLCTIAKPPSDLLAELAIAATGDAGDVLIFDSRLWHCAGTNTTSASRRLIKTLFSEPWVRPALDYRRALAVGKWEKLSPFVRGLLGERAGSPASVAEFRSLLVGS